MLSGLVAGLSSALQAGEDATIPHCCKLSSALQVGYVMLESSKLPCCSLLYAAVWHVPCTGC